MTKLLRRIAITNGTFALVTVAVFYRARALSQQSPVPDGDTLRRATLAEQFLTLSGVSEDRRTAIANALPKTKEATKGATDFWRKLTQEEIKIYADLFTAEELQGLITFYQSPAGKAYREKQHQISERWEKVRSDGLLQFLDRK